MTQKFTYGILQYKHSQLLNEVVNIGILFFFPDSNEFHFIKGDIGRVKSIYSDVDSHIIERTINGIDDRLVAAKVSDTGALFKSQGYRQEFSDKLSELLVPDSTSLQFSKPYSASLNFTDTLAVAQKFSNLLLPRIDKTLDYPAVKEPYIIKRFVDKIQSRNILVNAHLRRDHIVSDQGIDVKFDVSWKNGTTHLLRPISFDFKKREDITKKAANNFGSLTLLSDEAKYRNYNFDLLLIRPRNEEFFKAYEDAKKILNKIEAPKSIIEEDKVDEYADYAANTIIADENS